MSTQHRIINFLSSPYVLNFCLPILMVFLIAGTIAQKYVGLYEATSTFFSSLLLWIAPYFPIPGMPFWIALVSINLACKLIFKSPWTVANSGSIITHMGALLLLVGGLFTALYSSEGFVDLIPSTPKSTVTDYHDREFVIVEKVSGVAVFKTPVSDLKSGISLTPADLPVTLDIIDYCRNCMIVARENADERYSGMAQHMQLVSAPLKKENEENMGGLTFRLYNAADETKVENIFVTIENVPKTPEVSINTKTYSFVLRKVVRPLPFAIELLEFKRENYPGMDMAKAYSSRVRIHDDGQQWESLISMNEPLRYKGYTLFQSSFIETPEGDISVLAVVWNAGRSFPYISGIAMCLGLILHLILYRKNKRRVMLLALTLPALACTVSPPALAEDNAQRLQTVQFAQLPVMHEGRIKPMNSFARSLLEELAGKSSGHDANQWLLEILFNPASAENIPSLKVNNPNLLNLLGLDRRKTKLYTYKEIAEALAPQQDVLFSILNAPEDEWTPAQRDFVGLQQNTVLLGDLLSSMSLFLPLSVQLTQGAPEALQDYAAQPLTYLEAREFQQGLQGILKGIVTEKGEDPESYTDTEKNLAYMSFVLTNLQAAGGQSRAFKVIPATIENKEWNTPWAVILKGQGTPQSAKLFENWQRLAESYTRRDYAQWNAALQRITVETHTISESYLRVEAVQTEYLYTLLKPFKWSAVLYALALGFVVFYFLIKQAPLLLNASAAFLSAGLLLHLAGIIARMYILLRPPVSTLYESVLFVGAVAVLYGLISYFRRCDLLMLSVAAFMGVFFHILGFSHDNDGDSMIMLSAVLNTNFWLATHVICITLGYAFCAITSLVAHIQLFSLARGGAPAAIEVLRKKTTLLALISLLFATVGTVLGGIWADQSWGRFWGWDPKENGALLIVLWLIWFLHGKIAGQMSGITVAAGLAYLGVIVSLSWFGVNILSVGLHAYGFTDSAAWSLSAYIIAETLLIGTLYVLAKIKERGKYHEI